MVTALITHADCFRHRPPSGHPECPERLAAVLSGLEGEEFCGLHRVAASQADWDTLFRVHDRAYVEHVFSSFPASGTTQLDSDTWVSSQSEEAILRAAGAVTLAVDLVMSGKVSNAFCAVRPPGHHALAGQAMGFCIINNIAVGVAHARAEHNLRRIAIIDFDVHHGNGTQAIFYSDPEIFYISTHQSPLYPGTGFPDETGIAGNILNLPLPPGAGSKEFRDVFSGNVLPPLRGFGPELILVSAGFDAHRDDPLASLRLDEDDFGWATERICKEAAQLCQGRVVSVLEGGYDLVALARSAEVHVRALMNAR